MADLLTPDTTTVGDTVTGNSGGGTSTFPAGTQEAWTQLANQMQPSQGPFAGGFSVGKTQSGGAQWMRRISLIIYGSATGANTASSSSSGGGGAASSGSGSGRGVYSPGRPSPYADTPSIDLPDVNVTAPAPKPTPQASDALSNAGLELGALRVTFNIHFNTNTTPIRMEARVYNLSMATMKKMIQFTRVQLSAGYKFAQYGLVFDGTIVQFRIGRENETDTYMEIQGSDGDSISTARTIRRHEPGTKESDVLNQLIKDTGIQPGFISKQVGTDVLQRPWILAGNTFAYIRQLMTKYGAHAFPMQGKMHVVSQREYLPGEEVVLSPQTGLIGIPETTPGGIQVRCLLNPKLQIGGLVKLDSKFISGIAFMPGSDAMEQTQDEMAPQALNGQTLEIPVPTSPTGEYKIYMMEMSGDTRGLPWYCDLICIAIQPTGAGGVPAAMTVMARSKAFTSGLNPGL